MGAAFGLPHKLKGFVMYRILFMCLLLWGCAVKEPKPEPVPNIPQKESPQEIKSGPFYAAGPLLPYSYLVKPGDWLSSIALAEYGDTTKWHHIYAWNRPVMGDNHNLIYPFQELQLRKPAVQVSERRYVIHTIKPGDTLWGIASKYYSDGRAWRMIFHDNRAMFPGGIGFLYIDQELRLRIISE